MNRLKSFAQGEWVDGTGKAADLFHAVSGEKIGEASSEGLDFKGMLEYARNVGNPKLRKLTFHERARMLKEMAKYLVERKEEFYKLSEATGATKPDSWVDIEGGIGTFFAYSSRGRREFPNETFFVDGAVEPPYSLPNMRVEYVRHEPPGIPTAFWRSVGPSHNVFVVERRRGFVH